ncbi:hypothetical protein B0H10DRAFT_1901612, partial [Mycena sp. CBHHK59/15]
ETCDADVAYPPGWYPSVVDGTTSFSTFAQYATGYYTGNDGSTTSYTVGDTVTPTGPYSTPSSSNCVTTSTIANGIALASLTSGVSAGSTPTASGTAKTTAKGAGTSSTATTSGSVATGSSAAFRSARIGYSSGSEYAGIALVSLVSALAAIGLLH